LTLGNTIAFEDAKHTSLNINNKDKENRKAAQAFNFHGNDNVETMTKIMCCYAISFKFFYAQKDFWSSMPVILSAAHVLPACGIKRIGYRYFSRFV